MFCRVESHGLIHWVSSMWVEACFLFVNPECRYLSSLLLDPFIVIQKIKSKYILNTFELHECKYIVNKFKLHESKYILRNLNCMKYYEEPKIKGKWQQINSLFLYHRLLQSLHLVEYPSNNPWIHQCSHNHSFINVAINYFPHHDLLLGYLLKTVDLGI